MDGVTSPTHQRSRSVTVASVMVMPSASSWNPRASGRNEVLAGQIWHPLGVLAAGCAIRAEGLPAGRRADPSAGRGSAVETLMKRRLRLSEGTGADAESADTGGPLAPAKPDLSPQVAVGYAVPTRLSG